MVSLEFKISYLRMFDGGRVIRVKMDQIMLWASKYDKWELFAT